MFCWSSVSYSIGYQQFCRFVPLSFLTRSYTDKDFSWARARRGHTCSWSNEYLPDVSDNPAAVNLLIPAVCVHFTANSPSRARFDVFTAQPLRIKVFRDVTPCRLVNTGLFEMIVWVLTTCHTQYTWDRSICIFFLFNRTTLQVLVTYLTGALYVHPLWFYKHQHDNQVRSSLFVACQRWWFQWRFSFVPSVPGYLREEEEHKPDPWRNPIERNHMGLHLENEVAVVKTPTIISNNPVYTDVSKTLRSSETLVTLQTSQKTWILTNRLHFKARLVRDV